MSRIVQGGEHPIDADLFALLARIAEEKQMHLADLASSDQQQEVLAALAASVARTLDEVQNPIRVYGARTEEMFRYVLAALRGARAIKREDAGDHVVETEDDVTTPDFRIVLRDGQEVFVEVKNCDGDPSASRYETKVAYLRKLAAYGRAFGRPVYLAIYWRRLQVWTLLDVAVLLRDASGLKVRLPISEALRTNCMWLLGDASLGTRFPLTFRMHVDGEPESPEAPESCAGNEVLYRMTIRNVDLLCEGVPLRTKRDQAIALGFMRHGRWEGTEEVIMDGDRLSVIAYHFAPVESDPNHEFAIVSSVSSLASAEFNDLTVDDRGVRRLRSDTLPAPPYPGPDEDYHGDDLPLWRFVLHPASEGDA